MSREEIVNHIAYQQTIAAFEYASKHFDINKTSEHNAAFNAFEAGAEWMQKKMIEKACEWLWEYYPTLERAKSFEDAWKHFKKAMED